MHHPNGLIILRADAEHLFMKQVLKKKRIFAMLIEIVPVFANGERTTYVFESICGVQFRMYTVS